MLLDYFDGMERFGMQFQLCHENDNSLRLRLERYSISPKEEDILSGILSCHPQINGIQIYPATSGIRIFYKGDKKALLDSLQAIPYSNILYLAENLPKAENINVQLLPGSEEVLKELKKFKKIKPYLKRKIGRRVSLEALADLFLPAPLSLAYHVYQLLLLSRS